MPTVRCSALWSTSFCFCSIKTLKTMSFLNTLLCFLFFLLAGFILIFGLIFIFCILHFSIRLTLTVGETKVVTKFSKAGMVTLFYFYNPSTKQNAAQVDTKFGKIDLLDRLVKEIFPDYSIVHSINIIIIIIFHLIAVIPESI